MFKTVKRWTQQRTAIQQLSQLSNRELEDIGISRSDIYAVARGKGRNQ